MAAMASGVYEYQPNFVNIPRHASSYAYQLCDHSFRSCSLPCLFYCWTGLSLLLLWHRFPYLCLSRGSPASASESSSDDAGRNSEVNGGNLAGKRRQAS